ncbi:MAG: 2-(1,2-epoxy-1,2-dihydrophenyl)acetyl-CoA isomerase PaaG [Bdellovibrio sp.]
MNDIIYKVTDSIATITINRPQVYNALNRESKLNLIEFIQKANQDSSVSVILLTSEGKAFCSGQDLNDRTVSAQKEKVDLGQTLETEWNPLVEVMRNSEKIIIAALNGVCAGAGVSVALAADFIYAHPSVKFVSGFSKIGLVPDAGSNHAFVRAMGYRRALEFFTSNRPMMTDELMKYGLINMASEDYLQEASKLANQLKSMAPISLRTIKKNLRLAEDRDFSYMLSKEIESQRICGFSEDYQEGLKAFFEKRAPQFQGK